MSVQTALFGATELLPTLPGKTRGIVGVRPGKRGNIYTLQCANCFELEEPQHLSLMETRFHPRSPEDDNPRLCKPCRLAKYTDCTCDRCSSDRGKSIY